MLLFAYKIIRNLRRALLSRDSARQLAWGVAFGVLLGLVPKDNLLAPTLALVLLCLTVNHTMALATTALVMMVGSLFDPTFHRLGHFVLSQPQLRLWVVGLQQLPLIPWFHLNNTVVLGSFSVGLVSVLPAYWAALPVFEWWKKRFPEPSSPPPAESAAVVLPIVHTGTVMETQIDVVRLRRVPTTAGTIRMDRAHESHPPRPHAPRTTDEANEALRYLVRHIRDNQEEKAA